jgi:membrane protein DedA with SNARE-associated domain
VNLEFLRQLIEDWGYPIVLFGIMIESSGIPFPGETVLLVAAAISVGSTHLAIGWVIFWASAGAIIGDNLGYWAGRKLGQPLLDKIGPLLRFNSTRQAHLKKFFDRHGAKTIFLARFISLLRAWAAFFAGLNAMHYYTFLFYNALGGICWAVCVGLLGFFFGQNLPRLEHWLGNFSYFFLGLIALAIIIVYLKRRHSTKPN